MRLFALSTSLLLVGALTACAAGTGDGDRQPRTRTDLITAEEIRSMSYESALELVQATRPQWLRTRGRISIQNPDAGEVVVYMDGIRYGGPEVLRQIQTVGLATMQYLSASDATNRFGTGHAGGAILVTTQRY